MKALFSLMFFLLKKCIFVCLCIDITHVVIPVGVFLVELMPYEIGVHLSEIKQQTFGF